RSRQREDAAEQRSVAPVGVDLLVGAANRALETEAAEERLRAPQQRACAAGEEQDGEHRCGDDEAELEPDVAADVVAADGEQEADRSEQQRRGAAEDTLEQD